MFFISWTLVLSPVYQHTSRAVAVEIFSLGFPLSDMVVASLAIILATRASGHRRVSLGLVSIGLVWVAGADSSFSYLTALDRYGIGNTTDLGWVLGYFLVALGALWAYDHPISATARAVRPTLRAWSAPIFPSSASSSWPSGKPAPITLSTGCPRSASWRWS